MGATPVACTTRTASLRLTGKIYTSYLKCDIKNKFKC